MSKPASGGSKLLSLNSKITFGKYKNERLENAIIKDPGWVRWACTEIDWFNIDSKASEALDASELAKADTDGPYENLGWGDYSDMF